VKHKRRKGGLHLNGQQSGVRPQQWRDLNRNRLATITRQPWAIDQQKRYSRGWRQVRASAQLVVSRWGVAWRDVACPIIAANTAMTANQPKFQILL